MLPAPAPSHILSAPLLTATDQLVSGDPDTQPTPSLDDARAEIDRKLEESVARKERLANDTPETRAPDGITVEEVTEQRRLLDSLIAYYQAQVRTIVELKEAQKALADAQARNRSWPGFDEPPPYSVLMVDQLRDAVEAARGKVAALESSMALLQRSAPRSEDSAKRAESATRLAGEQVEKSENPSEASQAAWRRDLAELRERTAQNYVVMTTLVGRLTKAKLAAATTELELLERQLEEARKNTALTKADLEKVQETAKQNNKELEQELQTALTRRAKRTAEREKVETAYKQARAEIEQGASNPATSSELALLEAKLRAAETWLETTRFESETLTNLTAVNRISADMWEHRNTLVNGRSPEKRQTALQQLRSLLEQFKPWRSYLGDLLALARAEERKQMARLDSLGPDAPSRRFEQETLEAFRVRAGFIERQQSMVGRIEQTLIRWLDEYQDGFQARPLTERLADQSAAGAKLVERVWEHELFTVEDTVDFEGQTVRVKRGITFGKSVGAVILFLVGYWLSALLARRLQRILVHRLQIDEPVANVFRRWALAFLMVILLVMILNLVRIPLTVFAFLGGALAIGVGFSTQTLLKNLISGVMVLIERKIKVGDIIEVDSIVGTVVEIDIRSSTIRGFDGIETVIPNASFIEQRVTNWTYTSRAVRRTIKVGVAYGSPVRRVAEILLECAGRHGLVLKEPRPFAWLEDFGDSAINFGLYFWVELAPNTNSYQVMSDLRFMIVEAFHKASIVIAFPQRDLHLGSDAPLRVEMVTGDAGS